MIIIIKLLKMIPILLGGNGGPFGSVQEAKIPLYWKMVFLQTRIRPKWEL